MQPACWLDRFGVELAPARHAGQAAQLGPAAMHCTLAVDRPLFAASAVARRSLGLVDASHLLVSAAPRSMLAAPVHRVLIAASLSVAQRSLGLVDAPHLLISAAPRSMLAAPVHHVLIGASLHVGSATSCADRNPRSHSAAPIHHALIVASPSVAHRSLGHVDGPHLIISAAPHSTLAAPIHHALITASPSGDQQKFISAQTPLSSL